MNSPTYPPYEENPYQQGMYGQGPLSSESLYAGGTPTRGGKIRPSQPPPAPPSNSSTPSANTPTRSVRTNLSVIENCSHTDVLGVAVCLWAVITYRLLHLHLKPRCLLQMAYLPT